MSVKSLKTWAWLHKWTSLICTAFMLLLCLTGLPLIFSHEINHLIGKQIDPPDMPTKTGKANIDVVLKNAKTQYPNHVVQFVARDIDDDKTWTVTLGKTIESVDDLKFIMVDSRTAKVLYESKLDEGFMHVMFKLHVDLFAGLPGTLFLGLMGVLLIIAIISGAVLYAPFMRRLAFGEIRKDRSPKLKRLDTHNFVGIVTLMWFLLVGITGVINTLSELVIKYWQLDQMAEMTAPYKGLPAPIQLNSLQAAVDIAVAKEPAMKLGFVAFPGTSFSSPHHYGMFMRGASPVSSRLIKPILIDAQTSKITDSREIPWYLTTLLISQPLHFGDYGGMPLKVIWLVLDVLTIVVLWTGLMLWWKKRNQYTPDIEARINLSEAY
jgi:uncharacterized iron-regulated membrane protein